MRIPRIYQAEKLFVGLELQLSSEPANHLVKVLRTPVGAFFYIFNEQDGEYKAKVVSIVKNQVMVQLLESVPNASESPLFIELGQGIARGEKMDFVIQKAVELGVNQITPLITERCGVKLNSERWEKRVQHWKKVAIAACEQSGRCKIPTIQTPQPIYNWITNLSNSFKLILNPHKGKHLKELIMPTQPISILIGPEGGLTNEEILYAEKNAFINLNLGPRILRTETAGLITIALLQAYFGDL